MQDQSAAWDLVCAHMDTIRAITIATVAKMRGAPDFGHYEMDDLVSCAVIAAHEAALRFDPAKASFATYVSLRIRYRLTDLLWPRRKLKDPSSPQIISIEEMGDSGVDRFADPRDEIAECLVSIDLSRAAERLNAQEATVLSGVVAGRSGGQIADAMGLTESRISQIRGRVGKKLKEVA